MKSTALLTGVDNNANATLKFTSGKYVLQGGTINGGTLDQSVDPLQFSTTVAGTLNGVTVTGGDLQVTTGGMVNIQNGLTVTNHNVDLGTNAVVQLDGASQTPSNLNFNTTDFASLVVGGPASTGAVKVTLDSNTTLSGPLLVYSYSQWCDLHFSG